MMLRQCFPYGAAHRYRGNGDEHEDDPASQEHVIRQRRMPRPAPGEDGTIVALGTTADAATFAQLPDVLPGERAVCGIDPDVILRAADELRRRGYR